MELDSKDGNYYAIFYIGVKPSQEDIDKLIP